MDAMLDGGGLVGQQPEFHALGVRAFMASTTFITSSLKWRMIFPSRISTATITAHRVSSGPSLLSRARISTL